MTEDDLFDNRALGRLAHFEDCQSAIDQMFAEAFASKGNEAFDDFLRFVIRFSNLSVYNAMLVRLQRPGAGAVATRRKWRNFGREVRPDAIPIVILQPFGPVLFLFEQGDTEGWPLLDDDHNSLVATGPLSQQLYDKTCVAAVKYQIVVEETDQYGTMLAGTAAGIGELPLMEKTIDPKSNRLSRAFRVRLNKKHNLATRYATLAHELGHVYCGHVGADSKGKWPDRKALTKEQKEVEAEAVSWLVCQRNGVKTRSADYLNALIMRADLSGISLYAIFEAANRVESRTAVTPK